MSKTRKKSEHYVDNKVFLQAMIEYKDKCEKAERENERNHQLQITLVNVF